MNISDLVGETTEYEKKEKLEERKPKSWCKSVSAFANTLGGSLYFGVADDGTVVGIDDAEGASEKISEQIKARISPIPTFNLRFLTEGGKNLVALDVPQGDDTPYYYAADGTTEAYIRVGNESVVASPVELKRLVLRGMNETFDSQKSGHKFSDFSFSKLRERYKQVTGRSFEEKDFYSFGIVDENGILTNAGALLADACPFRHSRVFCVRWNGLNKAGGRIDALDSEEFSGSLISLLNESAAFVKRNMRNAWRKLPTSRENLSDYMERGYFEAIVNGLIHRDYLEPGSEVHIDMFDDRMEIYSPGGMVDGSVIQDLNLNSVPSRRRNPLLADIFARLDYMERSGSGIGKIIDSCEAAANYSDGKAPVFYSDRTQFCVVFSNLNYEESAGKVRDNVEKVRESAEKVRDNVEKVRDNAGKVRDNKEKSIILQEQILEFIQMNGQITRQDVQKIANVKERRALRILQTLVEQGILTKHGSTKGSYYTV